MVNRYYSYFCGCVLALAASHSALADNHVHTEVKKSEIKMEEKKIEIVTTPTGLRYRDDVVGTGDLAQSGKRVKVHYTGWLNDNDKPGIKFDSSKDRNSPFEFNLGAHQVIAGWDEGVAGMRVGGKRMLLIPANLAYGERGAGHIIKPNAPLMFEVEMLEVK
jgi:peptidylprolyl isomerase